MTAKPIALTRAELDRHKLPRVVEATKDDHGRLLVVAGSRNTPGSIKNVRVASCKLPRDFTAAAH